jgi:hypothetical protein
MKLDKIIFELGILILILLGSFAVYNQNINGAIIFYVLAIILFALKNILKRYFF